MQDPQTRALLKEIRKFLKESKMAPSYFGAQAARQSGLIDRLEAGGTVTLKIAERVHSFMAKRRAKNVEATE